MAPKRKEPRYDYEKDLILDCHPNTYAWFHERRHQTQFKSLPWLKDAFEMTYSMGLYVGLTSSILAILKIIPIDSMMSLIGIGFMNFVTLHLCLELDALFFGSLNWFIFRMTKGKIL